jgi:tripartite-type tricarboxylate transporter receptor subunit TctC
MSSGKVVALLGLLFTAGLVVEAQAQPAGDFYKGKQITLITSASVGGGYDQYARILAKHMPRCPEPTVSAPRIIFSMSLHRMAR